MMTSLKLLFRVVIVASGVCFACWIIFTPLSSSDSSVYAAPPGAHSVNTAPAAPAPVVSNPFVVLGYNELGMHCMNQDFSEMCILPPYNTLKAQVIYRRGEEPRIVTSGVGT